MERRDVIWETGRLGGGMLSEGVGKTKFRPRFAGSEGF